MSDTFREFLGKQAGVYAGFRMAEETVRLQGVLPDPVVTERKRGFLVAFRPDPETAQEIALMSGRIADTVPGTVLYGAGSAHITITDHAVRGAFEDAARSSQWWESEMKKVTSDFASAVREALAYIPRISRENVRVEYTEVLAKQTTVIAAGQPNETWFEVREAVLAACRRRGYDVSGSWGAHATVARFRNATELSDPNGFFDVLNSWKPCESRPEEIVVGYFVATETEFVVQAMETIPLVPEALV